MSVFSELKPLLLKELRGPLSQMKISKMLGYSYNQSYRWEKGKTQLSWLDFVRYCRCCRADLKLALEKSLSYRKPPRRYDLILGAAMGAAKVSHVCERVGVTRYKLDRWLKRQTVPSFEDVLDVVEAMTGHGVDIVHDLAGLDVLQTSPSTKRLGVFKKIVEIYPEVEIIDLLLALYRRDHPKKPYRQGYISEQLGIPLEKERRILDFLCKEKLVDLSDASFAEDVEFEAFGTTPRSFDVHTRIVSFWLDQSKKKLAHQANFDMAQSLIGYRTMMVDPELDELLAAEQRAFYQKMIGMVHDHKLSTSGEKRIKVFFAGYFDPVVAKSEKR